VADLVGERDSRNLGRPPRQQGREPGPMFGAMGSWSVQPCVRPFNAVHMTAGHNALRGSDPDQHLAFKNALAHVGLS
jgi:hypothetical protein